MNILLIYPSSLDPNGNPKKFRKAFMPPLSLAILDALTPAGHTVRIINDLVEQIDFSQKYDLVGITAMTPQIARTYQICERFKKNSAKTKIILGGPHPSVLPDEGLKYADAVVVGEADMLWEQVLSDAENNVLKQIYRTTELPEYNNGIIPKWENMNMKIYLKIPGLRSVVTPIFTSLTCPNSCKFCTVARLFGKKYRKKPINAVLKEIDAAKASFYFFVDNNLTQDVDYATELFSALTKKNIKWTTHLTTKSILNDQLLDAVVKAGCIDTFIGTETISAESLRFVNKNHNNIKEYEAVFKRLWKAGINPYPSFVFGFDEDTVDIFESTKHFLLKNNIEKAAFWILTPLPGSELFDTLEREGRLLTKDWSKYELTNVVFQPKKMSPEQLHGNFWKLYRDFHSFRYIKNRTCYTLKNSERRLSASLQMLAFQLFIRSKVLKTQHPLSGGI